MHQRLGTALATAAVVGVSGVAGLGCGGPRAVPEPVSAEEHVAIVASERGPNGPRLVAIDEHGDRRFALIAASRGRFVRDTNPAVAPAGDWIVFASNRDREDGTSLWIARLEPDAVPVRLTAGAAIEAHPTWTPDGGAIVYASTRARGDFDLWRLRFEAGRPVGEPEQLTFGTEQEVTPAVARDGTIYFAIVRPVGGAEVTSQLARRSVDGTITMLTEGPADTTPVPSPDGTTLAFARPVVHTGGPSAELWTMPIQGGVPTLRTSLPLTEESGPVWSRDGGLLFATSILRGEEGVLLSSVVFVELGQPDAGARILRDRAGVVARLTPAIATSTLDRAALRGNPAYLPELARIMATAIEHHRERAQTP